MRLRGIAKGRGAPCPISLAPFLLLTTPKILSVLENRYLNKLKKGDTVALKDSSGTAYDYRVSEVFVAEPNVDWAADPVRGMHHARFQEPPIVRADRT